MNDGSTDGSGQICKKYEHLSNVHYIEQDNSGVTAARKRGVDAANGEWIMFVDSDDLLVKDSISGIMNICEFSDIVIGANQRNIESVYKLPDYLSKQSYLEMQYGRELSAGPWAKMFRKRLFDEKTLSFPRHIVRSEDYLMNLLLALNNMSDVYIYKHQIYYSRNNLTSTTHTRLLTLDYMYDVCKWGDDIVKAYIPSEVFIQKRVLQRMSFLFTTLPETNYASDSHHPYIKNIISCMNEAGVLRPLDRWLLSVSSPWAVKLILNIRKAVYRIAHSSSIKHYIKKTFSNR